MADDTELMDERSDPLPMVAAPAAPVVAAPPAPAPAPNPAEGPGAFPSLLAYQAEYDKVAKVAAAQRNEEAQYNQLLQQSARTEDALKAITAARKFIATRKLGTDYQKAVASGLPHEQAWAQAAVQNLDAFGGNLAPVSAALRAARPAITAPALPTVAQAITDDTGRVIAHTVASSPNARHIQWEKPPAPEGKLSDVERATLKDLDRREKDLRASPPPPPHWFSSESTVKANADYEAQLAKIDADRAKILSKEKAPASGAKQLTRDLAASFIRQAGGDKAKARQLARDAGYQF